MTVAGIDPESGCLNVATTVFRLTPLHQGRPDVEHALVVDEAPPSWQVTMEGVQADGKRVPVVPRYLDGSTSAILGYEVSLSVDVLDTASLRTLAIRTAYAVREAVSTVAARSGADGWALEAWTPLHGARWAYLGAPWLSQSRLELIQSTVPRPGSAAADRYQVRAFCGITRPTSLRWPADAPPVLVDEDGHPRPMRIEPHMHFTCDVTTLAPPAR
ncbi:hypothetical protein ACIRPQ_29175 [Streptomyces sp. NPDC101213]|uniref:hypothetical protein n=1 Tax=Streptomyces sp. NPDC101213 TaxID=3366130 RepID=UPI0038002F2B